MEEYKKVLEILDSEVIPINDKDNELVAKQICDLFSKCTCKTPKSEKIHGLIKACVKCGKRIV